MAIKNKIGVVSDCFKAGLYEGLDKAKQAGVDGVQLYAMQSGEDLCAWSSAQRAALRGRIEAMGLEVSAVCGEVGAHGLQEKAHNPGIIEKSKRAIDLALALGSNIVTTHIGIVPEDERCEIYETMLAACEQLGTYATANHAFFAVETGPESTYRLCAFLDKLSTNGVSVNYDPANLVMVAGDDPVQGVYRLQPYIVHTHVKDGVQLAVCDPKDIYGWPGHPPNKEEDKRCCKEVPLGQGGVNFAAYFGALRDIGYKGYLTIERETGETPEADIRGAVQFIRQMREAL